MRRIGIAMVAAAVLLGSVAVVGPAFGAGQARQAPTHRAATPAVKVSQKLTAQLADARVATAKYATDLKKAKEDGYFIITPMIADMGYHYLNPAITDFDVTKPPILVYEKRGGSYQLGALEWVFPETPAKPPLKGATYGSFGAACHFKDGTFEFAKAETDCPATSPETGSPFRFWHPDLVTMHVWIWYPNPAGLFSGTNPLVSPFN